MDSKNRRSAYKHVEKHGGVSQYFRQADILSELNKENAGRPKGYDDGRCSEIVDAYLLSEIGRLDGGFEFDDGHANDKKCVQQLQKVFRKKDKPSDNWLMPRKGFVRANSQNNFDTLLDAVKAIAMDATAQIFRFNLRIKGVLDKDGIPVGHDVVIIKTEQYAKFFDPNHGEAKFTHYDDLQNWFKEELESGALNSILRNNGAGKCDVMPSWHWSLGRTHGYTDKLTAKKHQDGYSIELKRYARTLTKLLNRLESEPTDNPRINDLASRVSVAIQGLQLVTKSYPKKLDIFAEVKQRFERLLNFTQQLTNELDESIYAMLRPRLEQVVHLLGSIMESTITHQDNHDTGFRLPESAMAGNV